MKHNTVSYIWAEAPYSNYQNSTEKSRLHRKKRKSKVHKWKSYKLKSKKLNYKCNCRSIISNFFRNSSIYALNRIGNSSTPIRKIYWTIILIIGIAGCISQVGQFLAAYYEYPVIVNIETVRAVEQMFPAVTICNRNGIRRLFERCLLGGLNFDECFPKNKSFGTAPESPSKTNMSMPVCYEDLSNYTNIGTGNFTTFTFSDLLVALNYQSRVEYGHQAKNFILSCYFDERPCNLDNFEPSVSYLYGNCYTFNSLKLKLNTSLYGPRGGLDVILDVEAYDYATFTPTSGVRVQIHDPYTLSDADNKGITISPGFETSIAVAKVVYARLPPPYKDGCVTYEQGDNQLKCAESCMENFTLSQCFCSTLRNLREGIPNCDVTNPLVACCLKRIFSEGYSCNCPVSCEEVEYKMQISSAVWPARIFYETQRRRLSRLNGTTYVPLYEEMRESRLRLKVYYDSLDYMIYKQNPMYLSSELFSQIGGQMGLWLGLSLIFIFECLEKIVFRK